MPRACTETVSVLEDNYLVQVLDVGPGKQRHLGVAATVVSCWNVLQSLSKSCQLFWADLWQAEMRWCMFYLRCFIFTSSHIRYLVGQCCLWMIFVEGCFSISKLLSEMQSTTMVRCWHHSGEYRRSEVSLIKNSLLPLTFEYGCCLLTSPICPGRGQRFSVMKAPQY